MLTRGDERLGHLGVTISFGEDEVLVGISGDVDLATAPDLGAVLAVALERGSAVVIDLAATSFLGVAGLRVLEIGAEQLAACGRRLTIRSPSALVVRMLDLTRLVDIVNVEGAGEARPPVGTDASVSHSGHLRRVAATQLATTSSTGRWSWSWPWPEPRSAVLTG